MKISRLLRILGGAALCIGALFSATPALTASAAPAGLTCTGGAIAPGTYAWIKVTGDCAIPTGRVFVNGDLLVATGAALDGSSPTTQLIVYGDAKIDPGAIFVLGCSPHFGCETTTSDRIEGHVYANQPLAIIFHSDSVHDGITVSGGGGGEAGYSCAPNPMLGGNPDFSDFEDNKVTGNVIVSGMVSCWLGLFRNTVDGSMTVKNNTMGDPDANEVATNYIYNNLACFNNMPPAQLGDTFPPPNHVSGKKLGECATL